MMMMASTNAALRWVGCILALIGIVSTTSCLAFVPQSVPSIHCAALSMSSTLFQPTQSSLDKLDNLKLSIKKPRGASIGVEYSRLNNELSDGDLKILSMQLRRSAKAAAIWSSDVESIAKLVKEQESARGDFPGPLPVIYSGSLSDADVVKTVVDGGVTAVVADYGESLDEAVTSLLSEVGIIWKVSSLDEMKEAVQSENMGNVILLSKQVLPASIDDASDELAESLSNKSVVTIAQIQSMMPANAEIQLGKDLAKLGVSSLVLEQACVGDEEDLKYTAYAIEELNKKSSSSFSMTGLTGSTNGHFGVSSHGGEVKWRRHAE
eukprot:scaffold16052_cov112-Skeletonema_dohrnii-CCMP3373.AAC.1